MLAFLLHDTKWYDKSLAYGCAVVRSCRILPAPEVESYSQHVIISPRIGAPHAWWENGANIGRVAGHFAVPHVISRYIFGGATSGRGPDGIDSRFPRHIRLCFTTFLPSAPAILSFTSLLYIVNSCYLFLSCLSHHSSVCTAPLLTALLTFLSGLVRFISTSTNEVLIGQPVDKDLDVGAAILAGKEVKVETFSGLSVLDPGTSTGKVETVGRLLSPLAEAEVGTIRCIGLNVSRQVFQDIPIVY